MRRDSSLILKTQQGSALVVAIFVIVVLGVLVSVLSRLVTTSSDSSVTEVLGNRAFMAAQSGVQVAMTEIFPLNGQLNSCSAVTETITNYTSNGLKQCTSQVQCVACSDCAEVDMHYRLQSVGQCQAGGKTVSRQVAVELRAIE